MSIREDMWDEILGRDRPDYMNRRNSFDNPSGLHDDDDDDYLSSLPDYLLERYIKYIENKYPNGYGYPPYSE